MIRQALLVTACLTSFAGPALAQRVHDLGRWRNVQSMAPEWYGSDEAVRIADNVLAYQHPNGGWDKNINMAQPLTGEERVAVSEKAARSQTLIDNGATHTQIKYLMKVYGQTGDERYHDSAKRGIEFVLEAQYENGGWPMIYPLRRGYYTHITYNDGSMVGVLKTLRAVAEGARPFDTLDDSLRTRAADAVKRGVQCILVTQIVVDGEPTAWCAQHDEETLEPAKARSYELPSISGQESVGIVRFLMGIEDPSPEVIHAIESAVAWFDEVRISGLRTEWRDAPALYKGRDRVVVEDPEAPTQWARFYEIGTNRPMFVGRDGVVKDRLADIEQERRVSYSYLGQYAKGLAEKDYPRWRERVGLP